MKKTDIFAAALLTGIQMMGGHLTAYADTTVKKIVVNGNCAMEYLKNLDLSQLENCTVITIPGIPCTENGGTENGGTENGSTENGGTENSGAENSGAENGGTENSGAENDGAENGSTENGDTENETAEESAYHAYVLRVAELVNEERAKAGLQPLTLKEDITNAAQVRAVETEKSFSHTRPDGRHFATALTEAGVSYRGAGENIAWGQKTPEQVMEGWMNSAGHRANILNEKYTSIGIGYYSSANGTNYWTQLFTY